MYKFRNLILIFFLILNLGITYLNYLRNESFKYQKILIKDISDGNFSINEVQIDKFNFNYPSLAINTIPNKTIKARYLTQFNKEEDAIRLLNSSISENPFSVYTYYMLARVNIKQNNLYEALDNLRKGFEIQPNTNYLSVLYFSLLSELNLKNELFESINKISLSNNFEIWRFYYLSILKFSHSDKLHINKTIETASKNLEIDPKKFIDLISKN